MHKYRRIVLCGTGQLIAMREASIEDTILRRWTKVKVIMETRNGRTSCLERLYGGHIKP